MTETHICKNCGNKFSGKFCNECGEKIYTDHDKTLGHFFEEAFHFITHFDGKFFQTLKLVFFKPGFVSKAISNGVRKKYFRPVSLFLLGVIVYLLSPMLSGMNISFDYHLSQYSSMNIDFPQQWADNKRDAVQLIIREPGTFPDSVIAQEKMEVVRKRFDLKSEKVSKLLLFIIIPLAGGLLGLIFYRKKRFYFDHFTVAAEIETFFLYFMFLIMPLLLKFIDWTSTSLGGQAVRYGDNAFFTSLYISILVIYVTAALKRFYGVKTFHAFLKSLLFLTGHIFIAYFIYRIILFTIVMLLI